jgi:hypothetical protein
MDTLQLDTEQTTRQVPYLEDVTETIRDDAVEEARSKLSPFQSALSLEQLLEEDGFVDYFKYGLVSGVAKALAANDKHVQAIYALDPSANPDSETGASLPVEMTMHLIVKVSRSSAALEAFIDSLDKAMVRSLQSLPSPRFQMRTSILDVTVVTVEDVRHRVGYAALLSSMFAPALKIWERAD